MEKNYKKVRERCRKGIPMSVRPRAWLHLCGGNKLLDKYPGQYEKFLHEPGDPKCMDDIKKDLHRYDSAPICIGRYSIFIYASCIV